MANMIDYLEWRGDIPFSADAFNEVDNLILSELVYTDFEGLVPGPDTGEEVSLQTVCERFFQMYTEEEIMQKVSSTKVAPFLMKHMILTNRFGDMKLKGFVNCIDEENQSQFSVVTFVLGDGTDFIAFRGTDNTIVGWKEDFNMSFLYRTNGQMQAVAYLNDNFRDSKKKLRVGGHSKGGNFAVFSSAFCEPEVQEKIMTVYTNDGPGFASVVMDMEGYQRILSRVVSSIPESSIVGMLLENKLIHQVIKSNQMGAMQHDAMSWEIKGNHFVLAENLSESSINLDITLKRWVYGLNPEQREEFVNILFDALQSTGATTLDDLPSSKIALLNKLSKSFTDLPQEKQKALRDILVGFAFSGAETVALNIQKQQNVRKQEIMRGKERKQEN